MNGRCFLLPAIIVVMFAVSWSPAGSLPQAPSSHVKKTTAELLVGKWKMTQCEYPPLRADVEMWLVFMEGGKFEVHANDDRNGHQIRSGTYQLEGNTIRFSAVASGKYEASNWEEIVESITEGKATLVEVPDSRGRQPRAEYQRSNEKPGGTPKLNHNHVGQLTL